MSTWPFIVRLWPGAKSILEVLVGNLCPPVLSYTRSYVTLQDRWNRCKNANYYVIERTLKELKFHS
jgi:hypothetical protein